MLRSGNTCNSGRGRARRRRRRKKGGHRRPFEFYPGSSQEERELPEKHDPAAPDRGIQIRLEQIGFALKPSPAWAARSQRMSTGAAMAARAAAEGPSNRAAAVIPAKRSCLRMSSLRLRNHLLQYRRLTTLPRHTAMKMAEYRHYFRDCCNVATLPISAAHGPGRGASHPKCFAPQFGPTVREK